jgi:hypothetical protein
MEALRALVWPVERLGEALETVARHSGLPLRQREIPTPPGGLGQDGAAELGLWLETAAAWLGLEAESVEAPYTEVAGLVRSAGQLCCVCLAWECHASWRFSRARGAPRPSWGLTWPCTGAPWGPYVRRSARTSKRRCRLTWSGCLTRSALPDSAGRRCGQRSCASGSARRAWGLLAATPPHPPRRACRAVRSVDPLLVAAGPGGTRGTPRPRVAAGLDPAVAHPGSPAHTPPGVAPAGLWPRAPRGAGSAHPGRCGLAAAHRRCAPVPR